MCAEGEISAGKATEMLGIPRAAFYQLLAERKIPLPEKQPEYTERIKEAENKERLVNRCVNHSGYYENNNRLIEFESSRNLIIGRKDRDHKSNRDI